jgi:hypothetical protein
MYEIQVELRYFSKLYHRIKIGLLSKDVLKSATCILHAFVHEVYFKNVFHETRQRAVCNVGLYLCCMYIRATGHKKAEISF